MPYRDPSKKVANGRAYRAQPEVQAQRKANRTGELLGRKEHRFLEAPEEREQRLAKEREIDRRRAQRMTDDQRAKKKAYRKAWRLKNIAQQREYERARRVGIHPDEIERLRRLQNEVCALCSKPFPPRGDHRVGNGEHIDHDHETGRIRGLLCGGCNTSLGKLGDNAIGLAAALRYVSAPADPDCF